MSRDLFEKDAVRAAIEAAERRTTGEIVVSVAPYFLGSVQKAAERAFVRLGVARTRERNGVLIFIVPTRHEFVILGDGGINAHVIPQFWTDLARLLGARFHVGEFTSGLVDVIGRITDALERHHPRPGADSENLNELPDAMDFHPEP